MARFISLMGQNWPLSQEQTRLQVEEYALFFARKASIPDLVFLFVPEKDRDRGKYKSFENTGDCINRMEVSATVRLKKVL